MPAALVVAGVIYVGIIGPHSEKVDRQVGAFLHKEAQTEASALPDTDLVILADERPRAKKIIKTLRTDGVVAGKVEQTRKGKRSLHLVVYDGTGDVTFHLDIPLAGDALDKPGLAKLRVELVPSVLALVQPAPADDEPVADEPPSKSNKDDDTKTARNDGDSDNGDTNASSGSSDDSSGDADAMPSEPHSLHARAAVGVGIMSRTFSPAPAGIPGYDSSPVGSLRLAGEVAPAKRVVLGFVIDRTFTMSTRVNDGTAQTSISHWEGRGALRFDMGVVGVDLLVGLGGRSFVIDSKDPSRTPDSEYRYATVGGRASVAIGHYLSLDGAAAYQPVIDGIQPTEKAFGPARRWAVDLSLGAEARVSSFLYVRAEVDDQRFSWSWDAAGDRGAGGATDGYFGASVALGAAY